MNPAAAKIRMIKQSMNCLVLGVVGLLPVIGLPFALAALYVAGYARVPEKTYWNPARTHRQLGVVLGAFGAILWSIVDTLVIYQVINDYIQS